MRASSRTFSYSRTSAISTVLVATLLARTCATTLPTPPSPADEWLYPDVSTVPTYNYLDTVNASWTSNFIAPYLLLRCQHPRDAVHHAYPYNRSVSATGSALVPLDDGNAWTCHFQVSDLSTSSTTPPTFISNDFNVVLNDGQKPVWWTHSQDGGEAAASSATSNSTTASATASRISSSRISMSSTTTSSVTTTLIPLSSMASAPTAPPTTPPRTSSTTASTSAIPSTPTQTSTSPTPSSTTSGLSKSQKVAIIVGSTMGALLPPVLAIAVLFILRTRRSERIAVVYRSGPGNGYGYGSKEVPGLTAPRERWKGLGLRNDRMQGYF